MERSRIKRMISADFSGVLTGDKYKPGTEFSYRAVIVGDKKEELALVVQHDGLNEPEVVVASRLHKKGEMPSVLIVGVISGEIKTETGSRNMRSNDYDLFDREYGDFIVEELLPHLEKMYGCKITKNPDLSMVSGGSSGGISSFVLAWFHPDRFHRIYMSSPSFLAMGKGDELVSLVRKYETRPFRIWMEYSEKEPNEYFGSSYVVALGMKKSLEYAGYDMKCKYYRGEGHCSRYKRVSTLHSVYRYLWKGYDRPILPPRNSSRLDVIVEKNSEWKTSPDFPVPSLEKTTLGTYYAEEGKIYYAGSDGSKKELLSGFSSITKVAVSSDHTRLYVADAQKSCIRFYMIAPDGSLNNSYLHAMLHLSTDFTFPGAFDICVDASDRVYAATEMGIQCIRSFGLIDGILTLPDNSVPKKLSLTEEGVLYASSDTGVYCRQLRCEGKKSIPTPPKFVFYYD